MKFEPELVRDILLDIEELHQYPESFIFSSNSKFKRANKYETNTIVYHFKLLSEAGFINWSPTFDGSNSLYIAFVHGMTYQGHQFLDSVRSPKVWRETKSVAEKVGVFSLNFLSQTASQIITNLVTNPELFK
ncbi:DUF2513 domain-containing protein [Streptococcus oralis]|uniref:DUF2513 domain-containing protein n=1 Tax=Streptococcus oralis TaxID=1303 RepID=UPI000A120251|nr:DUF2513 domain-containing protein [Streptococcus oralis]MCY7073354.1 DUF2513 domain-containing protein [Streptococcus oralis]ORO73697.1 hypothetical protein B7710_03215 [Streptococcus oralis subsp. oralis]